MVPSGMLRLTRSTPSSPPFIARNRGVSIGPGAMQLTRTRSGAATAANERVNGWARTSVPSGRSGKAPRPRRRTSPSATAAAVIGVVLATYSVDFKGVPVPTATGFTVSLILGAGAAVIALVIAVFIPAKRAPQERHPSLPE